MHKWLLAAALLLFVAPVAAQPTEYGFTEDYLARVGHGDLTLVDGAEPSDAWTIAEYVRFDHDGNQTRIAGVAPADRIDLDCTCGNFTIENGEAIIGNNVAAGQHVIRLVRSMSGSEFTGSLVLFDAAKTSRLVAYVPEGKVLLAGVAPTAGFACTAAQGACTIHEVSPVRGASLAIVPAGVYAAPVAPTPDEDGFLGEWGPAILGILVGIALWSYLVSKGVVQKRRKQEVAKAAHVEAAATESQETLTARKRVLMAGLKELEKAKMTKEIETDVYDALKAELKKETVIVMRALESS